MHVRVSTSNLLLLPRAASSGDTGAPGFSPAVNANITSVSKPCLRVLIWRLREAEGRKEPKGSVLPAWPENRAYVSEQNSGRALKVMLALSPPSSVSGGNVFCSKENQPFRPVLSEGTEKRWPLMLNSVPSPQRAYSR